MHAKRKQRLIVILLLLASFATAAGLMLYALRQNINLFLTPSEIQEQKIAVGKRIRLGGLVQSGSVHREKTGLQVNFIVTDLQQSIVVMYEGVLPGLFREGQGVVVQGSLNKEGKFFADEVLAKHDENYMPPQIANKLKKVS